MYAGVPSSCPACVRSARRVRPSWLGVAAETSATSAAPSSAASSRAPDTAPFETKVGPLSQSKGCRRAPAWRAKDVSGFPRHPCIHMPPRSTGNEPPRPTNFVRPPADPAASKTRTERPPSSNSLAAANPLKPAPTTMTSAEVPRAAAGRGPHRDAPASTAVRKNLRRVQLTGQEEHLRRIASTKNLLPGLRH